MCVYLDCAATTPIEPRVLEEVVRVLGVEFGNSASRTHGYGLRARQAVEKARDQVAAAVGAGRGEIVFTSGATESNNLAILGLADFAARTNRRHLISTQIEHHAVLEPLRFLEERGFSVTWVSPNPGGWVEPQVIKDALRPDTLLVSVMHVNNETGVIQPIEEIAGVLSDHPAYFHVDAAQGFGTELPPLRNRRIDMISISGHKIYAPKGIGALVLRRRGKERPRLSPLMYGGGHELHLRPGTLPVHLIAGLGLAAELADREGAQRTIANLQFRNAMLEALKPLNPIVAGDQSRVAPHIVNLSFPGLDCEEVINALSRQVAIATGAACTAQGCTYSHVLSWMGVDASQLRGATRWSWCHMTQTPRWDEVVDAIRSISGKA